MGTSPDGIIGSHIKDCLYRQFGNPTFPYAAKFFGCYVIVADPKDITLAHGKVKDYPFSMSGSFTYPAGVSPCSIMVSDGKVIHDTSCHYWQGKPETVLYYTKDGVIDTMLTKSTDYLPKDVVWAIGGGQIAPTFNNVAEGFTDAYADVFRKTSHNAIGFDKYGNILGIYHPNCTLNNFQQRLLFMGIIRGIFVDGGHISAMNADTIRKNVHQKQGYIIRFER